MRSFLYRFRGPLLLFLGGIALVVVASLMNPDPFLTAPTLPDSPPPTNYSSSTYPSVKQPPVVTAAMAGLADADEVIGVVMGGKARAYPLRALKGAPQNHVVNDILAGTPVTVSYCDSGRCVRVFTHSGSEPLEINVAGIRNDEMMLKVGGRLYSQQTGATFDAGYTDQFPFSTTAFELTTWKKWREAHPDTEVSAPATPKR